MPSDSLVLADIGSVATKAGLIDSVGGAARLLGTATTRTTTQPPLADIGIGVKRALGSLQERMGRRLVGEDGKLLSPESQNGDGVDAFAAVTSAPLPLRIALVGLSRELSMASAQRAVSGTLSDVETSIALDEESARWGLEAKELGGASQAISFLLERRPEVIVLVGGLDRGALAPLNEMANMIAAVCAAEGAREERPWVVFAGNAQARPLMAERLGLVTELRVVDNVRPGLEREDLAPLQAELDRIYYERKVRALPGLNELAAWTPAPILTSAQGLENVTRYLAKKYALNVLALDLGASMTSLVNVKAGQVIRAHRTAVGLDRGAPGDGADLQALAGWLPGDISLDDARASLWNQALRPWTIPMTAGESHVLQAAGRVALARAVADWRSVHYDLFNGIDLCVLGGAPVARGISYGALVLMMLDALQLTGVVSLGADPTGLVPALGAVATVNPSAAAQVIERDGFVTLGTLIAPRLTAREGAPALQVTMETRQGGKLQIEVAGGALELIPLGAGERANVEIRPARGVELGLPLRRGVLAREMEGGALGLVIDARGRPLTLPEDQAARREKMQQWYWDVGG